MRLLRRISKLPPCLLSIILMSFLLPGACGCNSVTAVQPVDHAVIFAGDRSQVDRTVASGISTSGSPTTSPIELAIVVVAILLVAASTVRDQ
jgi:hypothetical protein